MITDVISLSHPAEAITNLTYFITAGPLRSSYSPFDALSLRVITSTLNFSGNVMLFLINESYITNIHGFIHSLTHVVNSQERHTNGCQRLHFDACAAGAVHGTDSGCSQLIG